MLTVLASTGIMMAQQDSLQGTSNTGKPEGHFFVGAGGGVKTMITSGNEAMATPTFDVYLGKWFTPSLGARLGFQGLAIKEDYDQAYFANHFWMDPIEGTIYKYGFAYLHADVMWNIRNSFGGYKERTINFAPYWHLGLEVIYNPEEGLFSDQRDPELAMGPGLYITTKLSDRFALTADVRDILFSERFHNYNEGGLANVVAGIVGVAFTF